MTTGRINQVTTIPAAVSIARNRDLRCAKRSFEHKGKLSQLCLASHRDPKPDSAHPPCSAAPICAFPSVRHAAIHCAHRETVAQRLHKGPLRCELRIASTRLLSLADTRFLTAVLFVSIHIVKQYKPPHSRTQTRNVLVLPFTAVAELGCVLLEASALANTCFTRMPNARLSQIV